LTTCCLPSMIVVFLSSPIRLMEELMMMFQIWRKFVEDHDAIAVMGIVHWHLGYWYSSLVRFRRRRGHSSSNSQSVFRTVVCGKGGAATRRYEISTVRMISRDVLIMVAPPLKVIQLKMYLVASFLRSVPNQSLIREKPWNKFMNLKIGKLYS